MRSALVVGWVGLALACGGTGAPPEVAVPSGLTPGGAPMATDAGFVAPEARVAVGADRVDFVDPGMNGLVVFSFTKPAGWAVQQSFTREWPSAVPNNLMSLSLTSPDGAERIAFSPEVAHAWSDGPMARDLRAMSRQFGLPDTGLAPMPAVTYVQGHLLPKLAQGGFRLQVTGEHPFPETQVGLGRASRGYVEGRLDDGSQARVEAQIQVTITETGGETYTSWSVLPVVVQSRTDVGATYERMRAVQASVVWNPAWQKANHELVQRGQASFSDTSRREHDARMDALRASGAARDQAFDERMDAQDRQHAAFIDGIRGEARFDDPTTGTRVRLEDASNHQYTDGQGNYLGTDGAPPPNWQELQRVELQDY